MCQGGSPQPCFRWRPTDSTFGPRSSLHGISLASEAAPVGRALQAVGVALPPNIREDEAVASNPSGTSPGSLGGAAGPWHLARSKLKPKGLPFFCSAGGRKWPIAAQGVCQTCLQLVKADAAPAAPATPPIPQVRPHAGLRHSSQGGGMAGITDPDCDGWGDE
jgi:hypothetical protein